MSATRIFFMHGPFQGWSFELGYGSGNRILAHVFTSVPGHPAFDQLSGYLMLRDSDDPSLPWEMAGQVVSNGGHERNETALASLLAHVDRLVPGADESRWNLWQDIVTAGVLSARAWAERYPHGRPAFEIVGAMSFPRDLP